MSTFVITYVRIYHILDVHDLILFRTETYRNLYRKSCSHNYWHYTQVYLIMDEKLNLDRAYAGSVLYCTYKKKRNNFKICTDRTLSFQANQLLLIYYYFKWS